MTGPGVFDLTHLGRAETTPESQLPNPGISTDPRSLIPGFRFPHSGRGSSLLEALIAVALIAGAVAAVAELAAQSVRSLAASKDRSISTAIAMQKIEQLLAQPVPPSDSPAGSLDADSAGCVDYIDARGLPADAGPEFGGVVYARRWAVVRLERNPAITLLRVRAGRCLRGASGGGCADLINGSRLTAATSGS